MVKQAQVKKWRRQAIISIAVAAVALVTLVSVLVFFVVRDESKDVTDKPQSGSTVTLEGEYECLPKPGGGPQTLECAFGLDVDGTHYGLDFTQMDDNPPVWAEFQMGDQIRVTGIYDERKTIYLSPGVIKVQSAEEL